MNRALAFMAAATLGITLGLAGCSGDDGNDVNNIGEDSGSASGSGSGSGSGLSSDLTETSDNPLVNDAVAEYHEYVVAQTDELVTVTKTFTDAIRSGDLEAATEAYAPSREPWERIEPIAGLIEELDGVLDSRVDDFEGTDDPEFTGWHRLEYILFEEQTTDGAEEFADKLDEDVATLQAEVKTLEIPAAAVPVGASELIEEVSLGKITGEEDRYSKTDMWDLNANVEGSKKAIELLTPALEEADPDLLKEINDGFAELEETLEPLKDGDGWVLYCVEDDEYPSDLCTSTTIDADTRDQLKSQTAALSENTAKVAGVLGLE